jgi:hypothetical protein
MNENQLSLILLILGAIIYKSIQKVLISYEKER